MDYLSFFSVKPHLLQKTEPSSSLLLQFGHRILNLLVPLFISLLEEVLVRFIRSATCANQIKGVTTNMEKGKGIKKDTINPKIIAPIKIPIPLLT